MAEERAEAVLQRRRLRAARGVLAAWRLRVAQAQGKAAQVRAAEVLRRCEGAEERAAELAIELAAAEERHAEWAVAREARPKAASCVHQPAAGVDTTHAWEPAEALRKAEARALAAQNDLQREREQARELFARLHAAEERAGAQARRLAELGGVEQGLSEALSRARLLEGRLAAAEAELARSQAQAAAADEARAAAAAGARAAAAAAAAARRADLAAAQRAVAAERRGALLRDELQAERDAARRTRAKAELLERQLGQASEGQQHQQQQQQQQQQRRDLEQADAPGELQLLQHQISG
ncbi:hypothetical protein MNEG_6646 [Monoraphidium neglectum]|uniref:Uncharacterized protein n=1 Tax=Monoraphidium neglectum TaxID=145388 RepID=A0A0D2JQF6_9CHLO|nr:hypothetical protein MNEG_6646 [Monoraphidium neglectum]KIZ01318.1 hypothetical protein MNEG_6646 [Monoraphidium neglectum]|eukprot:XP_013900337.1 hypothetical protein MNEG_6646 [Monoraphidium neglectum]